MSATEVRKNSLSRIVFAIGYNINREFLVALSGTEISVRPECLHGPGDLGDRYKRDSLALVVGLKNRSCVSPVPSRFKWECIYFINCAIIIIISINNIASQVSICI